MYSNRLNPTPSMATLIAQSENNQTGKFQELIKLLNSLPNVIFPLLAHP
jgi:hypothetical protein